MVKTVIICASHRLKERKYAMLHSLASLFNSVSHYAYQKNITPHPTHPIPTTHHKNRLLVRAELQNGSHLWFSHLPLLIVTMNKLNLFIFVFWKFQMQMLLTAGLFSCIIQLLSLEWKLQFFFIALYTNIDIIWWRIIMTFSFLWQPGIIKKL